jgi:hypothetical protein
MIQVELCIRIIRREHRWLLSPELHLVTTSFYVLIGDCFLPEFPNYESLKHSPHQLQRFLKTFRLIRL